MRTLARTATLAAIAFGFAGTAAADWMKSYVVEWNEPAMYYGAKAGVTDPGTDCPKGSNPEPNWVKVLMDAGYTKQEADWLRDPSHPFRIPNHGQNQMAFRGKDRANIYIHPELTPDPGLTPVTGKIGEGIDLDGNKANGFTSPQGEKGIDNEFYRTLGCWMTYRGPPRLAGTSLSRNDEMREGSWTILMVLSGKGDDPMNDSDVKIGFYNSKDPMVKDGAGNVARKYTFKITPDAKFEGILKAKTVNGEVVTTEPTKEMWLRDPSYTRELQLLNAQARFKMRPDGSLSGLLAGYRPWFPIYRGWVEARGSVIEQLTWVQLPGVWYALKRNADYSPEGANGEKTHISFAMRIDAIPAYVMTPDAKTQVASVESYKSVAPPMGDRIPAVYFSRLVVDGIVRKSDGTIPGGPNVVIPPPASMKTAA
ncbi:MAG TPA: hypothetical protein VGO52_25515, partial [Hyphomonadaceae bacterium]|nr:hypothetical protein [Hyphomonadaceae bacterium]